MNSQERSPSFSIIVETENLMLADMNCLRTALDSLEQQEYSIHNAARVFVQDSGNVSDHVLQQLKIDFPWISLVAIPHDQGHYEAKMICLEKIQTDIVIFCDSDCVLQPGWLQNLLQPFLLDPTIAVVGGETQMEPTDPFSLAMVLTHVFSLYSKNEDLFTADFYYANNVAFRTVVLRENAIPCDLPLFRGNCTLHARKLIKSRIKIWRQPLSRAVHAVPESWGEFSRRFISMGRDSLQVSQMTAASDDMKRSWPRATASAIIASKVAETFRRSWQIRTRDPQPLHRMFFAKPIVLLALMFFSFGAITTSCQKDSVT